MSNGISSKIEELELSLDTIHRAFEVDLIKLDAARAELISSSETLSSNQQRRLLRLRCSLKEELNHQDAKRKERDNFFTASQEDKNLRIDLYSVP